MKLAAGFVFMLMSSSAWGQSADQWPRYAETFQQMCRKQFDPVTCHCTLHRIVRRVGYDMLGRQLTNYGDELFARSCIADLAAPIIRQCSMHRVSAQRRTND